MMARQPHWQDPEGLDAIKTIIKKLIPNWTNGLHAVQLELVAAILDGKSVLGRFDQSRLARRSTKGARSVEWGAKN